ncbi:hypothetical protein GCM10010969_08400 [Saccharibacillus kuerlensis]|uniref:Uncharacterized protein n=2 Tax=Saccharibacillus kuerlensis TaxID=459527 RepID=A0ABQ2KUU2_9BACL|nr:hypothetical protein GCM10010969_08400 [Saccharibacillus kuerlensis]
MTYGGPWESFKEEKGVIVKPDSTVEISFPKNPDELIVRQHTSSSGFTIVDETNHTFIVPSQPGQYVYGISGKWEEGIALYGLKVEVK